MEFHGKHNLQAIIELVSKITDLFFEKSSHLLSGGSTVISERTMKGPDVEAKRPAIEVLDVSCPADLLR